MDEKIEKMVENNVEYLCGVIDVLVEFSEVISAVDYKVAIRKILEGIALDAYALGQESKE